LKALAVQGIRSMEHPVANEIACCIIAFAFGVTRKGHLSCRNCYPTSESRRLAKKEMTDAETCTFLANLDLNDKEKCGKDMLEKLILVDLFFPSCLPDDWRNRPSLDWLKDPELRRQCVRETLAGYTHPRREGAVSDRRGPLEQNPEPRPGPGSRRV